MNINTVYNECHLKTLKKMPDGFVQLTVTSPPYDKLRSYESIFDINKLSKELYRVTKSGGVVVWVVSDQTKNYSESGTSFKQALKFIKNGWCLYDTMIWKKTNFMPSNNNRYADAFEYMFVFSKGKPNTFNPLKEKCLTAGKTQKWAERPHESKIWKKNGAEHRKTLEYKVKSNVWEFGTGLRGSTSDRIAFEHPAIFPEKLASDHITTWSNEGDLVYDCFGGSGTVAKMAHLLNRPWIISEIDAASAELSKRRLAPYLSQNVLL